MSEPADEQAVPPDEDQDEAPDQPPEQPLIKGAILTVKEAAQACSVARITIRRAIQAERFPHAYKGTGPGGPGTGPWLIPVIDLLTAGFRPNALKQPEQHPDEQVKGDHDHPPVIVDWDEYLLLRERLARAEEQVRAARDIAEERAQTIEVLREALRRVPELPPAPEPQQVPEVPPEQPRPGRFRRWFLGET